MSEAYERERQNNSRLDELSAKVSALRGVTVDIYDNARAQDVIDNTVRSPTCPPSPIPPTLGSGPLSPWSPPWEKWKGTNTIQHSPTPSPPCATP